MAVDHYSLLGVPKDATTQDIKRAFRRIARECHPDVAGDDPEKVARFQDSRIAYEILMDPVTRARYDRRSERRSAPDGGGTFFDAFYKRTGDLQQERAAKAAKAGERSGRRVRGKSTSNSMSLDDLLDGFGGGRSKPPPQNAPSVAPDPQPGRDLEYELEVPADVAQNGGALTATYYRMRRADQWHPGNTDPGLVRVEDFCPVRVLPGTRDGQILREHGMGDAGPWGGPAGDLIVTVKIVGTVEEVPDAEPTIGGEQRVDLSAVEAILGARLVVDTPQGLVRLTVPAGTHSHTRMRLKGKGPADASGEPTDYYVEFRITVPRDLDQASRDLIHAFHERNS